MEEKKLRLGEILVDAGVLKQEQLEQALSLQKKRGIRLGQVLLQEGFISEPQLVQALSRRLSIPWVSLDYVEIADELLELVPASVAEEYFLIPVYIQSLDRKNRTLFVAMNDPTDEVALRFVAATAGMPVKPMVAGPSEISWAIQTCYFGDGDADREEVADVRASAPPIHSVSAPPPPPQQQQQHAAKAESPPAPKESREMGEEPLEPAVSSPTVNAEQERAREEGGEIKAKEGQAKPPDALDIPELVESRNDEQKKRQKMYREMEKHMFGVGAKRRGMSLTLLDGTRIDFGGSSRKTDVKSAFTKDDLVAGLRAAAAGTPMEDYLPAERWEEYMAALLQILFKKNLVFFEEFLKEIKKKS